MSEQQKVFASVSGAVVVHLIFFLFVFGLLSARSAGSSSGGHEDSPAAEKPPQEVTVLMSDLMEHLTIDPAPPVARSFVATDLNQRESAAPAKASYESDRNTLSASALRPNLSLPQEEGPTLAGKSALSNLILANRDFRDGDKTAAAPTASTGEVSLDEVEKKFSPNTRKSFLDSRSDLAALDPSVMSTEEDRLARPDRKEAAAGASAEQAEREMRPDLAVEKSPKSERTAPSEDLVEESFSPEELQSERNGTTAKIGQDAVDAEETALGLYQKAVRDVIAATWHRYRQDNAEVVTWGILKLKFMVDRDGQVNNLQITKNEANAILAEFSLKAIRDAKLPAMPADVAKSVGSQGLVIHYDIIIY